MKVVCIHDSGSTTNWYFEKVDTIELVFGATYTVVSTQEFPRFPGYVFYELEEYPKGNFFESSLFAPISDIDEKERSLIGEVPEDFVERHMEKVHDLVSKIKSNL